MSKSPMMSPLLLGVGSMLTAMIASGFILGYLMDSWLGTMPLFLLSFGVLGFVGGMLKVHKLMSKLG